MRSSWATAQGMSAESVFHHSASAPPGRSTRSASGTERAVSVQCQDWAYVSRSREPVASGSALPSPRTTGTSGSARRNSAAMPSPGSTATTSAPRSRSSAVAIPVPAPTSATRAPARDNSLSSATASSTAGG